MEKGAVQMRWYLYTLKNYAKFSGRATRKEYWIFTLVNKVTFWSLIYLASYSSSAFYLRANITLIYIAILSFLLWQWKLVDYMIVEKQDGGSY